MLRALLMGWTLLCATPALAHDVTTPEARKLNLLEYVDGREDLSRAEKREWDEALRLVFGGKAIKDGTDEGVTVAKSVVSAAVFFGVPPADAARAAYDAYHDTYRWVPPPIAIGYQLLVFQGRKPKETARQLAFDFPRYFNEEMAVDLVRWWDEMLASGKIPELQRDRVTETVARTRELMQPMLRDRLWQGAELEARLAALSPTNPRRREVQVALESLAIELERDFAGVAPEAARKGQLYERYARLARHLGEKPEPRPVIEPEPLQLEKPTVSPARPETQVSDDADPERPRQPGAGTPPSRHETSVFPGSRRAAPLAGDRLIRVEPAWPRILQAHVESWLGTPYRFGGTDRRGVDCSAFVRAVFRESVGLELPRNSRAQFALGRRVDRGALEAGDLVFFDTLDRGRITHVGVFVGADAFAHASSSRGVTRAELAARYYQRAFRGGKRLLEQR